MQPKKKKKIKHETSGGREGERRGGGGRGGRVSLKGQDQKPNENTRDKQQVTKGR